MAKLGVVIPAYNYGHYLKKAVGSVLDSGNDIELVIVDDGSTDNTSEIVEKLRAEGYRFRYIYQPNSGPAAARNSGIQEINAEFLLLLDADDQLCSGGVEKALTFIAEHDELDVLIGGHH